MSPRPRQHLCSPVFLLAILVGVKWHLVVVFNFIFQMTNDIKHLFMCLLVTRMSSLEKCKGLVLRSFSFSVKCPKTLNHGGAGHTPQSYEGAQRMQRVRIGSARAVFPLPCAVAPALTRGCPLFRDFPKSHMAGDVARTLVLTLKVSLTLWTLRILECSLYNCPLVSKGDRFQDPCGCPSSRILWPSRRSGQRLSTTCLCTRIQRSARRGANSGFAFGNFLHF